MKSLMAFSIFLLITVICSLLIHGYLKRYFIGSILAAFISTAIFQVLGYLVVGYLDPFFLIALVSGLCISFIVSLIVGLPFLYFGKRRTRVK